MSIAQDWLGAGGLLSQRLVDFQPRVEQLQMAEAVEAALADDATLIVEAGTGTGKTFAYLAPALASGKRVLISTGTKALQDQLFRRDLPQLLSGAGVPLKIALLKGRANYLCLYRMDRARSLPSVQGNPALQQAVIAVEVFARHSEDGDLAPLEAQLERHPALRPQITSTAENCLGSECPVFNDCHVAKARRKAIAAQMVVVNHHVLFSDYVIRQDGFGQLLGSVDAVIIDEAHQLPALAAQFFGVRVSSRQWRELARDSRDAAREVGDLPELEQLAETLAQAPAALDEVFAQLGSQRRTLAQFLALPDAPEALDTVRAGVNAIFEALRPLEERSAEFAALTARALDQQERLQQLFDEPEGEQVRWVEPAERGGSLYATPLSVSDGFRQMVGTYPGAWILTSATLTAGLRFDHYVAQMGLEAARTLALGSPFDFATQARLWIPRSLPQPNDPQHSLRVAQLAASLSGVTEGGLLVLCTSHRALREISDHLRKQASQRVLRQGDAGKAELLAEFAADGHAILVATQSFWEGVDVRGRALRVLMIDRMPFAPPGDPVADARAQALKARGEHPFRAMALPEAILQLRQGAGRLIRDPADRGLLVICDPRLQSQSYGRLVRASLPQMPECADEAGAMAWAQQL
ncbi:ATP-dependent DNA helicase [Polycyclovorans algicola]|uniref:ATP-dependent DNA helicase n=1 Tax=Polycyclovorans algicola TaxID=616992 RepID=UPI0005BC149E|nr:ATP-dependent DNA helicase [Polycyclovorans algicola]